MTLLQLPINAAQPECNRFKVKLTGPPG